MPTYQIHAVSMDGQVVALGTCDTASRALVALRSAQKDHPRAWVVDENSLDVAPDDLMRAARGEQGNGGQR
jgi:hypothetical protein